MATNPKPGRKEYKKLGHELRHEDKKMHANKSVAKAENKAHEEQFAKSKFAAKTSSGKIKRGFGDTSKPVMLKKREEHLVKHFNVPREEAKKQAHLHMKKHGG